MLDEVADMKPAAETIPVAEYTNELGLKSLIDASNVETLTRLFYKFQISADGSEAAIKLMMVEKWSNMIDFQPLFPTDNLKPVGDF